MLDEQQVSRYKQDGFIVLDDVFVDSEVAQLREALREDVQVSGPHRIMEDDGVAVRAIYASHTRHPVFHRLVRQDRLLGPVRRLLAAEVYVYQLKVNAKNAFVGAAWAWHQDYVVWRYADNLPTPAAVNVALLLDDITEFNGPLIFLAGSHAMGDVEPTRHARDDGPSDDHIDPAAFTLDAARLSAIAADCPMTSPKARAGAVILFHPQVVHASGQNMSPFDGYRSRAHIRGRNSGKKLRGGSLLSHDLKARRRWLWTGHRATTPRIGVLYPEQPRRARLQVRLAKGPDLIHVGAPTD